MGKGAAAARDASCARAAMARVVRRMVGLVRRGGRLQLVKQRKGDKKSRAEKGDRRPTREGMERNVWDNKGRRKQYWVI